jgi:hypothetical protein
MVGPAPLQVFQMPKGCSSFPPHVWSNVFGVCPVFPSKVRSTVLAVWGCQVPCLCSSFNPQLAVRPSGFFPLSYSIRQSNGNCPALSGCTATKKPRSHHLHNFTPPYGVLHTHLLPPPPYTQTSHSCSLHPTRILTFNLQSFSNKHTVRPTS